VTVCAFTTDPTDAPLIRLLVEADEVNRHTRIESTDGRQDHDDPPLRDPGRHRPSRTVTTDWARATQPSGCGSPTGRFGLTADR